MKLHLISYKEKLPSEDKVQITTEIINSSDADLLFFPGHTVDTLDDAMDVAGSVKKKNSFAVIEVARVKYCHFQETKNNLFLIHRGKLVNLHTFQLFATSDQIEGDDFLAEALVNELETRRQIVVDGKNILLMECGENNIIKNIQSDDNRAEIRINDATLVKRFKDVLKKVDIILNVIHDPQLGNQNRRSVST